MSCSRYVFGDACGPAGFSVHTSAGLKRYAGNHCYPSRGKCGENEHVKKALGVSKTNQGLGNIYRVGLVTNSPALNPKIGSKVR